MTAEDRKLEFILARMASDDSYDAPADAVLAARNIYAHRLERRSLIQRITARIAADIGGLIPATGERSAAAGRQLLLDAGDVAIDIRISGTDGELSLAGQILGELANDARIEIVSGDAVFGSEIVAARFEIDNVPRGTYTLIVRSNDVEIVLDGLVLS